eukprot:6470049-Amphidinium_carterae.1
MAEVGLSWMHSGGLDLAPVCSLGDMQAGCFKAASRTSPLSFAEDGRGRLQHLCTKLLDKKQCDYEHVKVERYPLYLGYVTESAASSTVLFKAERLAVPSKAAVVELDPWLSQRTREQWNDPLSGEGVADESATSYFAATQREWRWALRIMFRAGLLRLVHPQTGCAGSSAGAFSVAKDKEKDRLIGDRRPANAEEVMAGP